MLQPVRKTWNQYANLAPVHETSNTDTCLVADHGSPEFMALPSLGDVYFREPCEGKAMAFLPDDGKRPA
jgi:hypothetical protein